MRSLGGQGWLGGLESSTRRLTATVQEQTDEDLKAPSLLPGWSRAHVVAHLARNADGLGNLVAWAQTGTMRSMYTSARERAVGIARTAELPGSRLRHEYLRAVDDLGQALEVLTPEQWGRVIQWRHERGPGTAQGICLLRWAEVEIHHADLDAGYRHTDWPAAFVTTMLPRVVEEREVKGLGTPVTLAPAGSDELPMCGGGVRVTEEAAALLGWLLGRLELPDAPHLPPWR